MTKVMATSLGLIQHAHARRARGGFNVLRTDRRAVGGSHEAGSTAVVSAVVHAIFHAKDSMRHAKYTRFSLGKRVCLKARAVYDWIVTCPS